MTLAILAFIAAQIADVWTTVIVLRQGGTEANPVVAWLMRTLGGGWIVAKLAVTVVVMAEAVKRSDPGMTMWVVAALTFSAILTGAVALWNRGQIK